MYSVHTYLLNWFLATVKVIQQFHQQQIQTIVHSVSVFTEVNIHFLLCHMFPVGYSLIKPCNSLFNHIYYLKGFVVVFNIMLVGWCSSWLVDWCNIKHYI